MATPRRASRHLNAVAHLHQQGDIILDYGAYEAISH
jgi:hypothetical protein